ncbi:MAG: tetratricopeptide repeat protein [Chthoniobacterales bacterium]
MTRTRTKWTHLLQCFGLLTLFVLASTAFAAPDTKFSRANDEFANGKMPEAIRDYEALVQEKKWSAPLFYNLGNAFFRTGDFGRAILNYERALALDPQQPETVANLTLAREEARSLELQHGRMIGTLLKNVTENQLTVAASVGVWMAIFAVAGIIFNRRRTFVFGLIAAAAVVVAVGCAMLVYQIDNSQAGLAIVTAREVQARLATADNAASVLQLPSGSEVGILSRRGDWTYVILPNSSRGWIPSNTVEQVRL